jgi:hypothetical protein
MNVGLCQSVSCRLALIAAAVGLTLAARPVARHPGRLCTAAIQAAERTFDLPAGILMAVALTETGRRVGDELTPWPWSINAAGEGAWLEHRRAAIERTRDLQASGIQSIDVGCMQVNLRWHKAAFESLEAAFDPNKNVSYAARHLKKLRGRSRDWLEAAGRYHSADPALARRYQERLSYNWRAVQDGIQYQLALLPRAPGSIALGAAWASVGGIGPLVDVVEERAQELLAGSGHPLLNPMPAPGAGHAQP